MNNDTNISAVNLPAFATAVANAAHDLCLHGLLSDAIRPEQPLDVVVLDGQPGPLAWLLVHALEARLSAQPLPLPAWRIRMPCAEPDELAALAQHPYLAALFESGHLSGHLPDAGAARSTNPPILISAGWLGSLPALNCCVVHGALHRLAPGALPEEGRYLELGEMPSLWEAVLAQYRESLSFSRFSIPQTAAEHVDAALHAYGGKGLLLALERGVTELRQIRLGADAGAAVNLHALAHYQVHTGAAVWQQRSLHGMHVHVALHGAIGLPDELLPTFARHLLLAAPLAADAQTHSLMRGDAPVGFELPALLALSNFDPTLLAHFTDGQLEPTEPWHAEQLLDWRDALDRAWLNYFPQPDNAALALRFARLAWLAEHWRLVREALGVALHFLGEHPDWLCVLASCETACGRLELAAQYLEEALALDSSHAQALGQQAQLAPRLAAQNSLCEAARPCNHALSLCLEPLTVDHAAALLWQYRDPQIAVMTDLPHLLDLDAVHAWLDTQQAEEGRRNFALMHPWHGFVGVVSYIRHAHSAFAYFWIGCDYQGMGLAAPAVDMLIAQAQADGIAALFTSAFPDNARSLRVLAKAGFVPLDMPKRAGPDDELDFLVLQLADIEHGEQVPMLDALCRALQKPIVWESAQEPTAVAG